jgi:hypothetical protein
VIFPCLLLAACTANEVTQSSEVTQQTPQYQQWKNQAVQHYRYQLEIHDGPWEPLVVNIEVRNGTIVSETAATTGGRVKPVRPLPPYNTIDHLFDVIEEAETGGADKIEVVYDPKLGYPTSISTDDQIKVADDGTVYLASDNAVFYAITTFKILD